MNISTSPTQRTLELEATLNKSLAGTFHDFGSNIRRGLSGVDTDALKDFNLFEKYLDQGRADGLQHIIVSPHVAELVSADEAQSFRQERAAYYENLEVRIRNFQEQHSRISKPALLNNIVLISGYGSEVAATEVGLSLGKLPVNSKISRFANGELDPKIFDNVRRKNVYIIAGTTVTPNEDVLCLQLLISNAKKHSANEIHVITPHFSYARQDRDDPEKGRSAVAVAEIARSYEYSGADSITALDLHCVPSTGATKIPFHNVSTLPIVLPEIIKRFGTEDLTVITPDAGAAKRAELFHAKLAHELPNREIKRASIYKTRINDGEVDRISFAGSPDDIRNRVILIPDDMIDSGGTLLKIGAALKEFGAKKTVAIVSHGIFSGTSYEKIKASKCEYQGQSTPCIDTILSTDTITRRRAAGDFLVPVSIAPMLAKIIYGIEDSSGLTALNGYH